MDLNEKGIYRVCVYRKLLQSTFNVFSLIRDVINGSFTTCILYSCLRFNTTVGMILIYEK